MLGILLGCAALNGCESPEARKKTLEGELSLWRADSAKTIVAEGRWLRDSAVVDSLSRRVDLDSLRALYRRALVSAHPAPLAIAISCEHGRLMWHHGGNPAILAIRRLEDSIWRVNDERAFEARLPENMYLDDGACPKSGPRAPSYVAGAPMFAPLGMHPHLLAKPRQRGFFW